MLVPIGLFSWEIVRPYIFYHLPKGLGWIWSFSFIDNFTWMTTVKSSRAKKGALSLMSERSMLTTVVEDKGGIPVSQALIAKE